MQRRTAKVVSHGKVLRGARQRPRRTAKASERTAKPFRTAKLKKRTAKPCARQSPRSSFRHHRPTLSLLHTLAIFPLPPPHPASHAFRRRHPARRRPLDLLSLPRRPHATTPTRRPRPGPVPLPRSALSPRPGPVLPPPSRRPRPAPSPPALPGTAGQPVVELARSSLPPVACSCSSRELARSSSHAWRPGRSRPPLCL